jgi:hypothetical protein
MLDAESFFQYVRQGFALERRDESAFHVPPMRGRSNLNLALDALPQSMSDYDVDNMQPAEDQINALANTLAGLKEQRVLRSAQDRSNAMDLRAFFHALYQQGALQRSRSLFLRSPE